MKPSLIYYSNNLSQTIFKKKKIHCLYIFLAKKQIKKTGTYGFLRHPRNLRKIT